MSNHCSFASRRKGRLLGYVSASILASMVPVAAQAATVANPICTNNTALFDPGNGQDIVVPPGFRVSRFTTATLNFPTGIAFRRAGPGFEVYVLESGHGLPSQCNNEDSSIVGGTFSPTNPFTPTSSYSIKMETRSEARLPSPQIQGAGSSRMARLSTSRSRMDSTVAACSQPIRTSRCERRGTTTARAL